MHQAALEWVARWAPRDAAAVLDVGGRDVNGSPRHLFNGADYVVVDPVDGPNVNIVADVVEWAPEPAYDVVLCLEVLEHVEGWRAVLAACVGALVPGGLLVVTAGGLGRPPHSAADGGAVRAGEWYANICGGDLADELVGLTDVVVDVLGYDVRAVGRKAGAI